MTPRQPLVAATSVAVAFLRGAIGGLSARDGDPGADAALEDGRGRAATTPAQMPAAGWRDIAWRTYEQISLDRVMAVAAGVTFYALLAVFPAITAMVSVYGLFADPATMSDHLALISGLLPQGAVDIVAEQMSRIVAQSDNSLGIGFVIGLAVALWSANQGVKAIFDALNVAYGEREKRGFILLNLVSLTFTLAAIAFVLAAIATVVVLPAVFAYLGLSASSAPWMAALRWPVMLAVLIIGLGVLYRFGPSRRRAKWRWVSAGSLLAAVVWLVASVGFSWYVGSFGSYNEIYGSLGAAIGFMMWIWISASIVLIGAELNAEIEHQTARDSTVGPDLPMGVRGARMADTIGRRVD